MMDEDEQKAMSLLQRDFVTLCNIRSILRILNEADMVALARKEEGTDELKGWDIITFRAYYKNGTCSWCGRSKKDE